MTGNGTDRADRIVLASNYDPVTEAEVMVARALKAAHEDHHRAANAHCPVLIIRHHRS